LNIETIHYCFVLCIVSIHYCFVLCCLNRKYTIVLFCFVLCCLNRQYTIVLFCVVLFCFVLCCLNRQYTIVLFCVLSQYLARNTIDNTQNHRERERERDRREKGGSEHSYVRHDLFICETIELCFCIVLCLLSCVLSIVLRAKYFRNTIDNTILNTKQLIVYWHKTTYCVHNTKQLIVQNNLLCILMVYCLKLYNFLCIVSSCTTSCVLSQYLARFQTSKSFATEVIIILNRLLPHLDMTHSHEDSTYYSHVNQNQKMANVPARVRVEILQSELWTYYVLSQ